MRPEERKDVLRRLILARRSRLSDEERDGLAALITDRVLATPEIEGATSVLAFSSIRSEVPTRGLLEAILASSRTLLLPYVADDGALRAAVVRSLDELEPGYRRIPEPRHRFPVDARMASVAIVPGVAFDLTGARLGYGGGFYDAFLGAMPDVPRIGVCFEMQIVDAVPVLDHDERVDAIATEERLIRCRG